MLFKSACFSAFALTCCFMAGCCSGNSLWHKPAYAPTQAGSASRTYTPTETVSPYQQPQQSFGGGSGTTSGGFGTSGGSGTAGGFGTSGGSGGR